MSRRASAGLVVAGFALALSAPPAGAITGLVISRVSASVVQVRSSEGLGTGFGFGTPGLYLTNAHVVGADGQVTITDPGGRSAAATVVAIDRSGDIAELRSSLRLTPLPQEAAPPQVGETVATVGSPQGLEGTATIGNIGAVSRPIEDPYASRVLDMIQLAMGINHGNSGGPLVDASGRVVGVITLGANSSQGVQDIGFALPIGAAAHVLAAAGGTTGGNGAATATRRAASAPAARQSSSGLEWALIAGAALALAALGLLLWRRLRPAVTLARPRSESPVDVRLRATRRSTPAADVRLRRRDRRDRTS